MAWLVAAMTGIQSLAIGFGAAEETLPFTGPSCRAEARLCSHALSLGLLDIRLKPEPQPAKDTPAAESHPGEDRWIWK